MSIKKFFELQEKVLSYYKDANTELLKKAYVVAADAHINQKRANNEPYIIHSLSVAGTLADMKLDDISIAAALLHDVVEDTDYTRDDITRLFGEEISDIVWGVTRISKISDVNEENAKAETLKKMIQAIIGDVRIIFIKLAEHCHNIRTLDAFPEDKQKRIAKETLDIYAPIAYRLGMGKMKTELEDIAFKYAYPEDYKQIVDRSKFKKRWANGQLKTIKKELEEMLEQLNIKGDIQYRIKREISIYRELQRQDSDLEQVDDRLALRIITDTVENCYALMGEIHHRWTLIHKRWSDFITTPKSNGYQSIHTTVMNKQGVKFDIQIRTREMHVVAEEGIAAYWRYKEGISFLDNDRRLWWFRDLIEIHKDNPNPRDFLSIVKGDLTADEVFVFTPKGKAIYLPKGATPIDFAYAIHREVGEHCKMAIVNENLVPLKTELNSGDVVELITSKEAQPTGDWLKYALTGRARKKIMAYLREKEITLGRYEEKFRNAIAKMEFESGEKWMEKIKQVDKSHGELLYKEFEIIYPPDITPGELVEYWSEKRRGIEWWHKVWLAMEESNKFRFKSKGKVKKLTIEPLQPEQDEMREVSQKKDNEAETPLQKGNKLENAILELLREFFKISEQNQKNILINLRKQGKGPQYGRDLEFACFLKGEKEVKCYIECKNYQKADEKRKGKQIRLNDISEKLLQSERSDPDLHHWILVSPFVGVSNEINEHLNYWETVEKFPFKVQFWTPETGVEEFFGLKPDLYDAFGFKRYKGKEHPRHWSKKKEQNVIEKWQKKLEPPLRLPSGWKSYLKNPNKFVLKHEDLNDFSQNYENYVRIECKDEAGIIRPLEDVVLKWLDEPVPQKPTLMLLGEFGDGKSFFTYCFTRKLAEEFCKTQKGWIPVRFSLREFRKGGPRDATYFAPQDFLKQRIELFGADLNSWYELREKHSILVILDGFDEMSTNLDNKTILENTHALITCCKEFEGLKILITSRKHFFENKRDKNRLFDRIGKPGIYNLVPIEKNVTRNHLRKYAKKKGKMEQFIEIQNLHDPIGLAQKPLFMQMIKETLDDLPEKSKDIDEMVLYETYTRRCLRRKIEQLEEYRLGKERGEIVSEMIKILEKVALKLQESGQEIVYLQDFKDSSETQKWVEALWAITELDESLEEDATARVAVRSLLKRMPGEDEKKWPVDFCHRSMKEYFVALGVCRMLREDIERAESFLKNCYLNYEIIYFAGQYMNKNNAPEYEQTLLKLIRLTRKKSNSVDDTQMSTLGCNTVNLLYRYKKELPGNDWAELILDNAIISEADLSGKNFSGSSLRYANLDNTILENADFRNSDLTGVMLEETEEIKAILVPNTSGRLYAIYGDGIIREWRIDLPHVPHPKNLYQMDIQNVDALTMLEFPEGYINFFRNNDFQFFQKEEDITGNKLAVLSEFNIKPQQNILSLKENSFLLREKGSENDRVLLIDTQNMALVKTIDFVPFTFYDNLGFDGFLHYNENSGLKLIDMPFEGGRDFLVKESQEVTCITAFTCDENTYLIGWGQKNGFIHVSKIINSNHHWRYKHILEYKSHEGMVRDIKFINGEKVVSGGTDKKLCILEFDRDKENQERFVTKELQLQIRCKGMKIKGLKSDHEYEVLNSLLKKESQ